MITRTGSNELCLQDGEFVFNEVFPVSSGHCLSPPPIRGIYGPGCTTFPDPEGIIPGNGGINLPLCSFSPRRTEVIFSHICAAICLPYRTMMWQNEGNPVFRKLSLRWIIAYCRKSSRDHTHFPGHFCVPRNEKMGAGSG